MFMILIAHIVIALSSVIYTAYVYISPSNKKLNAIYGLVGLTVASGTWLIVSNPSHMVSSCVSGLTYLGIMFFGIALARRKLHANHDE